MMHSQSRCSRKRLAGPKKSVPPHEGARGFSDNSLIIESGGTMTATVGKTRKVFIAWIFGIVLFASILVWLPEKLVRLESTQGTDHATLVDKYRSTLAQAIGGLLLLLGLYFTARNVLDAEQMHLTKTLSEAIQQLGQSNQNGSVNTPVRLGAIYTLARLSKELPDNADIIRSVLGHYLETESRVREAATPKPSQSDLEGAFKVIGLITQRNPLSRDGEVQLNQIDLAGLILTEGAFARFHFDKVNLTSSQFGDTDRTRTDWARIKFFSSDLTDSIFDNCELSRSEFNQIAGESISFKGIRAHKAKFISCNFKYSEFIDADLDGCEYFDTDLTDVKFGKASLKGASMQGNTSVSGADFAGSDLSDADFRSVKGLTREQLATAKQQPPEGLLPDYLRNSKHRQQ
jgi:uncharacterized protein YjbI with pentapeptide repeats